MNAIVVIYPNKTMFSWELTTGTGSSFNIFSARVITSEVFNWDGCIPTATSFNLFFLQERDRKRKKEYKNKEKTKYCI